MLSIKFPADVLRNEDRFHNAFMREMGFPVSYERNMDAWIECMSRVDDPDAGRTRLNVVAGQMLLLKFTGVMPEWKHTQRYPLANLMLDAVTAVNERFAEAGSDTRLAVTII